MSLVAHRDSQSRRINSVALDARYCSDPESANLMQDVADSSRPGLPAGLCSLAGGTRRELSPREPRSAGAARCHRGGHTALGGAPVAPEQPET
jgi:hypothetical protein